MHQVDELLNLWSQYSDQEEAREPGLKREPDVTAVVQAYRGDDLKLVIGRDADLMQYTGLKDAGGKEIYEGDIVEYAAQKYRARKYVIETVRGQIVFGPWRNGVMEDNSTYLGPAIKEGSWYGHLTTGRDLTVIGNIHEHQELLKP